MTVFEPTTAGALRCERCGATLNAVASVVRCTSCGHDQRVAPDRLVALEQYQRSVMLLRAREQEERNALRQLDAWHGGRGPQSRNARVILVACTSSPMVLAVIVAVGAVAAGVSADTAKALASAVAMLGCGVGLVGYFAWYYGGQRRTVRRSTALQVALCPTCGAPTTFAAGQVLAVCKYCGSGAAANSDVANSGIGAVAQDAHLARIERYRAERHVVAGYSQMSSSSASFYPWVLGISLGIPLGVAAVGATWATATGSEQVPIAALVIIWGMVLGGGIALVGFALRRTKVRDQWRHVRNRLSSALGGIAAAGSDGATKWLDLFWGCPFPAEFLFVASLGASVLGQCRGYPVMLLLNPDPPGGTAEGFAEGFLAARFSGYPDDAELPSWPAFDALRARLATLGYSVQVYGGGFRVSVTPQEARAMWAMPERGMSFLGVAEELAQFAAAAQARPTRPMPPGT